MTAGIEVPVTLHLDHCPERAVITECLERGWNSVLFDASHLPVEENLRQTVEVVAEARRHGAHVEGEIESITGVEDGSAPTPRPNASRSTSCSTSSTRTEVDVFAPAIGNAHGVVQAGAGPRLPAGLRHRRRATRSRSRCTAAAASATSSSTT